MPRRISLVLRFFAGDFPQEVESYHQEPEEGHQEVLLVRRRRYVGDVVVGLEYAAHSPGVGDPELVCPVHAHRERQLIESVVSGRGRRFRVRGQRLIDDQVPVRVLHPEARHPSGLRPYHREGLEVRLLSLYVHQAPASPVKVRVDRAVPAVEEPVDAAQVPRLVCDR